ncbi:hypothetical protein HK103_000378 [Boothiomyces macroporosus]|uniref:Chitin-binding type-1 domain-containing protein n=1 Tax=Boothiomyces macroporosus TaxID=261099 RepID=A0AAD5Y1J5_9FUNG|nr:hypothetical protein HK103_000378 [Boothiomyces macroporosus]
MAGSLIIYTALSLLQTAAAYSGSMSYYGPPVETYGPWGIDGNGIGACALDCVNHNYFVAMNTGMYQPGMCGLCVKISYNGRTTIGPVVDRCPGCPNQGLDLSPGMFTELAGSLTVGRFDADWEFITCPSSVQAVNLANFPPNAGVCSIPAGSPPPVASGSTAICSGSSWSSGSTQPAPVPVPAAGSTTPSTGSSTSGTCGVSGVNCGSACCSRWGYCGTGPAYCGSGCQANAGTCDGSSQPVTNPAPATNPSSAQPDPVPPVQVTPPQPSGSNICDHAGMNCGSLCCSQYGYCGSDARFCGVGCQPLKGSCTSSQPVAPAPVVVSPPSNPAPAPPITNSNGCGGSLVTYCTADKTGFAYCSNNFVQKCAGGTTCHDGAFWASCL